jgi:hypothetical protein
LSLIGVFQLSLKFEGKARGLPKSGAPEKCFARVGSGLTHKHWTRLERPATDKHSSLLQKSVNYRHKKFYSTGYRLLEIVVSFATANIIAPSALPNKSKLNTIPWYSNLLSLNKEIHG